MTPKEKAKELYDKFNPHARVWDCYSDEPLKENHAKQCALICVDEIIHDMQIRLGLDKEDVEYWQDVKTEIEKL